jgi:hypothetical protein
MSGGESMRWIQCDGSFAMGVAQGAGRVQIRTAPPVRDPVFTAREARELALELMAAADKVDPQPPARHDPGPRRSARK